MLTQPPGDSATGLFGALRAIFGFESKLAKAKVEGDEPVFCSTFIAAARGPREIAVDDPLQCVP